MGLLKYSIGNKKIGIDTLILNLRAECSRESRKFCQLPSIDYCYDRGVQRFRLSCKRYRQLQEMIWQILTASEIIDEIRIIKKRRGDVLRYVRFQEGGDFKHQEDVDKTIEIAEGLKSAGLVCYTYTSRRDLDYSQRGALIVNGSGWIVDNNYKIVSEFSSRGIKCKGNCKTCKLCKKRGRKEIETILNKSWIKYFRKGGACETSTTAINMGSCRSSLSRLVSG